MSKKINKFGYSDETTTLRIYIHSNLAQDKLIVENKYGNRFVSNILNFKVITSIIIGIKLASYDEI